MFLEENEGRRGRRGLHILGQFGADGEASKGCGDQSKVIFL